MSKFWGAPLSSCARILLEQGVSQSAKKVEKDITTQITAVNNESLEIENPFIELREMRGELRRQGGFLKFLITEHNAPREQLNPIINDIAKAIKAIDRMLKKYG